MAYQKNKFHIKTDLSVSPYIDRDNSQILPPDGFEGKVPDLTVGQSFRLVIECYDDYDDSDDTAARSNFDGAVAELKIKRRNSTEPGTVLATGAAAANDGAHTELNTFTFDVIKDQISDYYDGKECTISATITEGSDHKTTLLQELRVLSSDGTGDNDIDASDIVASTYIIKAETSAPDVNLDTADGYRVGDYVWHTTGSQLYRCDGATAGAAIWTAVANVDAWPGQVQYLLDTSAGDLTLALPGLSVYDYQHITASKIDVANVATISGTINGTSNPALYDTQAVDLFSHADAWYQPHYDKFI